ncbi:MAG: EAL domain-containing protein [Ectothiorhodospiraceae bacterium]|nr:EAL domain-containing protein [Ectothiorhodospiraceae bacterium]
MDQPNPQIADIEPGFAANLSDQPPVYILSPQAEEAAELAAELRELGFRTRHFVRADVLVNAARQIAPGALVADSGLLAEEATRDMVQTLREEHPCSLFLLSHRDTLRDRLAAVRLGGDAFFLRPLNVPVLAYRLQHLATGLDAPCTLAALDDGEKLNGLARELEQAGHPVKRLTTRPDLLATLTDDLPDLLLVNGDMTGLNPLELLPALRQYPGLYSLPVLLMTAGDKRRFDGIAERAALDGIVGSNISSVDLAGIIRSRVRRARGLQASWRYHRRRDPASGLHSRAHFMDELRQAITVARQTGGGATLIYLTATAAGNSPDPSPQASLVAVAGLLQRLLPPPAVGAHLQQGQFAAMVYTRDEHTLDTLITDLRRHLGEGIRIPGSLPLCFDVQLGTTLLGSQISSPLQALDQARRAAGEQPEADTGDAAAPLMEREWKSELGRALKENRFRLVYQPIASLTGQPTNLYEVFVRMLDGNGQDLLPQEFLPPAQRLGLNRHIDRWVILRALNVLAEQQSRREKPVFFIKLFAETLETRGFALWLAEQIRSTGVAADHLVFQLSKQAASHRLQTVIDAFRSLRDMGCGLALEHYNPADDHQDLLAQLPLDYVKISPELTRDMLPNPDHLRDIQGLASRARKHGLRTIAALIQDASAMSGLWGAGIDYIQGYFMQPPADVFGGEELAHGTDDQQ